MQPGLRASKAGSAASNSLRLPALFTRILYVYEPPRPLEEIDADLKKVEQEIVDLLAKVTTREDVEATPGASAEARGGHTSTDSTLSANRCRAAWRVTSRLTAIQFHDRPLAHAPVVDHP